MEDKIREILDRIETASEIFDCLLKPEECTELLDYITNLQQENDDLKNRLENAVADCNLRLQENERLKELCDKYEEEHNTTFKEWQKDIRANRKAKEYIENYDVFKEFTFPLMKKWEENQVKSSIDYQFKNDLKKNLINILEDK